MLLKERLYNALFLINKDIPKVAIDEALRNINITKHVSLIENNRAFHKMITDGVSVSYHDKMANLSILR